MGKIRAVCISEKKGTAKKNIGKCMLIENHGLENDSHAGNWHRQVSLLSHEAVEAFRKRGASVADGAFGENLLVEGFDFKTYPVGTRFRCNDVILEITQIGKQCHSECEIFHQVGDCIMPREGVFARVLHGGTICVGDELLLMENKPKFRAGVITASDKGSRGEREDLSGPAICGMLEKDGYEIVRTSLLPDDEDALYEEIVRFCDEDGVDVLFTTGGTGFSPRDCMPEATLRAATKNAPGIAEAIRYYSLKITPRAMLSRAVSVIRNQTLIINLPGSTKAVKEGLECILPSLEHGIEIMRGDAGECGRER
ncbi:MAG: MOSC domain-containing protein [Lachnospiraceae bacterium]|nr:MOSC domain-containing protein [Lachnospiraceae bacterium]